MKRNHAYGMPEIGKSISQLIGMELERFEIGMSISHLIILINH
jgi:hypothetical protein